MSDESDNGETEKKMKERYRDRLLHFYLELKQTCQEFQENGDPTLATELAAIEDNFTQNFSRKEKKSRGSDRRRKIVVH
jgi:hypothetical protein